MPFPRPRRPLTRTGECRVLHRSQNGHDRLPGRHDPPPHHVKVARGRGEDRVGGVRGARAYGERLIRLQVLPGHQ